MSDNFSIIKETPTSVPDIDFGAIKNSVLGKKYTLNLILTSAESMRKLNAIYRDKNNATDILSFPISKNEGEIYMSLGEARKEAKKFGREFNNFIAFLFIHGCVHLKGYDHGSRMENIEIKFRKKFGI